MQAKARLIDEIRQRTIFQILESDFNRAKREYEKIITIGEMLPQETGLLTVCYQATEDIMKAKEVYETMDIVELWELYSVKLACEYQDPYRKRKE